MPLLVSPESGTTLFVFARAPEPGRVKTRLIPAVGAEVAALLHAAFLDDVCRLTRGLAERRVLAVAGPIDHPHLVAVAAREGIECVAQVEGDLGARMEFALHGALAAGAHRAVVIGSDSPHLPPLLLARAVAALDAVDVVVGPAEDGGYWTIGLRAPFPSLFEGIGWGGPTVLAATTARLREGRIAHALCDPFWDVDEPADLARLRRELAADPSAARAPATRAALEGWAFDRAGLR
ncbi:MAG: glycosyltransferase [Myxococcales bacterium]|nr:glycosyltransferase [Myxococcales bacterium]